MSAKKMVYPLIEFRDTEKNDSIKIIDGDRGVNYPKKEEMHSDGFCLFLNTGNIIDDRFSLDSADYISEEKDAKLRQGKLERKDVVLTTRGTVGSVAHYNQRIKQKNIRINSGMVILRSSQKINDLFFYNIMKSAFLKQQFYLFSSGSAQPQLPIKDLRRVKIPTPSIQIQKKIAAMLSTYDDLIENNNHRIAILEKMAEEIYREWFVRLRFPGHEKVKIIKGVPEGWQVVSAGKYFKLVKGRSYSSEEIEDFEATENHRFFITLKNFKRGGGFRKDAIKYYCGKYNANQVVSGGSLVMAVTDMTQDRAVIGRIARIPFGIPESIISCDVVKIEPINISDSFLYASLRFSSYSESLKEFANGANVLHLKPELANIQKIIVPPKLLRDCFDDKFKPLIKSMDSINNTRELLTASRDRLLSRLMSGKIDVENMDIKFPASMQEEFVHA